MHKIDLWSISNKSTFLYTFHATELEQGLNLLYATCSCCILHDVYYLLYLSSLPRMRKHYGLRFDYCCMPPPDAINNMLLNFTYNKLEHITWSVSLLKLFRKYAHLVKLEFCPIPYKYFFKYLQKYQILMQVWFGTFTL